MEPVVLVIQAITHTYDAADPTLWVPVDQRPGPVDDSIQEMRYTNRQNCGYRSLMLEAQATLGYVPADESSNGPFIVGIICTHLSGVSIAFDVRRLTYEEDGMVKLDENLYAFLANREQYYWLGAAHDVFEALQQSLCPVNVPPMVVHTISDVLDEFGMLEMACTIGAPIMYNLVTLGK